MRLASAISPGAGYWTRYNASGKPDIVFIPLRRAGCEPKSWIVSGRSLPVVKVPSTNQWADTARMAFSEDRGGNRRQRELQDVAPATVHGDSPQRLVAAG